MKGLRGLFRLGTLTLLALTLMATMVLPASAAKTCSSSQMLGEVEIVSVAAKESPAVWSAQGLVNFDYGGDIENGLLEVSFKDIATDFDFDGYIIEATPGDDDPGDSAELGVMAYTSPSLVARPTIIGDTVTEVLNLEPGTKYYVTVHAVNHNTVQISPKQRPQDSAQSSATTLLSAPFLGAIDYGPTSVNSLTYGKSCDPGTDSGCQWSGWRAGALADDDFKGTHFALYGAADEAGQHYFHWLNPADYGPFDHLRDVDHDPDLDANHQADMLSLDKDGNVEDHCADINGDCGHTHYRFQAVDENGTVASELVETNGALTATGSGVGNDYFRTVFTAGSGDLILSVSLGRMVGGKYKAMSDTASVRFEAPDDLRALDQTYEEYLRVLIDIYADYDENDDLERWLGKDGTGAGRSIWNPAAKESFADAFHGDDGLADVPVVLGDFKDDDNYNGVVVAHLNNQLK